MSSNRIDLRRRRAFLTGERRRNDSGAFDPDALVAEYYEFCDMLRKRGQSAPVIGAYLECQQAPRANEERRSVLTRYAATSGQTVEPKEAMTNTQLAELLLMRVMDNAREHDYGQYCDLYAIGSELGVTDAARVRQLGNYLSEQGLIQALDGQLTFGALITTAGALFVEAGGKTGAIGGFRSNPAQYLVSVNHTVDNSAHFYAAVSGSTVAINSPAAHQAITTIEPLEKVLSEMEVALPRFSGHLEKPA